MMLLLDFAVACIDCTGGNIKQKKKKEKKKKHGNRFKNNIDREYLSVNKYENKIIDNRHIIEILAFATELFLPPIPHPNALQTPGA